MLDTARHLDIKCMLIESVALLVGRRTNNRKVVGSRPTKVVYIRVLTGNRLGWTVRCGRPPLLLPSCRKLEFRLSALMDSDLAWVNGKSGRQSWCYAFQRSIISGAIYHYRETERPCACAWNSLLQFVTDGDCTSSGAFRKYLNTCPACFHYHSRARNNSLI